MADKFIKSLNFGGEDSYFPLPFVTGEQNGLVLKVVDGEWTAADLITLKPGLYDSNDILLASWNELINIYGMDVAKDYTSSTYKTDAASPYLVLNNNPELATGTKLIIDSNIVTLYKYTFRGCAQLESIVMPAGITSIDESAFNGCTNLKLTELPAGISKIRKYTFYGCTNLALTELPAGITSIGEAAFNSCTNLKLTELPAGVSNAIGSYAFYNCSNLSLTELPAGITVINLYAFAGCTHLKLTELPTGITTIRGSAFRNCTGLTELTFKGTPSRIDADAFLYCTNLTTINVPWAEGAVANAPWGATNATINYNYNPYINPDVPEE